MRRHLRHHLPWLLSVLAATLALNLMWPPLARDAILALRQARSLETALPDSLALRRRIQGLAHDSVRVEALRTALARRTVHAADPAAQAVEECLATLAPAHWQIERVQPDAQDRAVRIRLAGSSDLGRFREGLSRLEQGPLHVQVRSLSLRKDVPSLRFELELVYAQGERP